MIQSGDAVVSPPSLPPPSNNPHRPLMPKLRLVHHLLPHFRSHSGLCPRYKRQWVEAHAELSRGTQVMQSGNHTAWRVTNNCYQLTHSLWQGRLHLHGPGRGKEVGRIIPCNVDRLFTTLNPEPQGLILRRVKAKRGLLLSNRIYDEFRLETGDMQI